MAKQGHQKTIDLMSLHKSSLSSIYILDISKALNNIQYASSISGYGPQPFHSLLLHGVSAGPCFFLRVRRRKHACRHAGPRDGLKVGPALTPSNNRLSSGRAMLSTRQEIYEKHQCAVCTNVCAKEMMAIMRQEHCATQRPKSGSCTDATQ